MTAIIDSSTFMGQGSVSLQRRLLNGLPLGPSVFVGQCDKLVPTIKQTFDAIPDSITGLRTTIAKPVTRTEGTIEFNLLDYMKQNLVMALQGTDTGNVAAGTVSAEITSAYNAGSNAQYNGQYNFANIGTSAEVIALAGTSTNVTSIAVTAGGSGYAANTAFPMTLTSTVGNTATAYSNSAGVIVGVIVAGTGTTLATGASITTPGAGSGATFQINKGGTPLVSGTDYTVNHTYGIVQILPGSTLVPYCGPTNGAAPSDGTYGLVKLTNAYSYAAYNGRVEAFTTGIQYFTVFFYGLNTVNNQAVTMKAYQMQMEMTKTLQLIEAKHGDLTLSGELLMDTTIATPSLLSPLSQFMTITKA